MKFTETTANEFEVHADDGTRLGYVWLIADTNEWAAHAISMFGMTVGIVTGFKDKQSAAEALENGEA